MTIFTEKPTLNRRAYQFGLDDLSSGSGIGTFFDNERVRSPIPSIMRAGEQDMAAEGRYLSGGFREPPDTPLLEPDDANERFGIEGQLSFDAPVREKEEAQLLNKWSTERLERESILRRSDKTLAAGTGRLAAGFLAQALDPINIATAFIPVVGQVRYARWLGQASGATGRAGVRAGVGAVEGAVGTALVEPIIYAQAQREQAPYDLWDSFTNVIFGAGLGGGLHAAGGAVLDRIRRPTAGEALVQDIGTETHSAALQGAAAAIAEDRPVRVAEVLGPSDQIAASPARTAETPQQMDFMRASADEIKAHADALEAAEERALIEVLGSKEKADLLRRYDRERFSNGSAEFVENAQRKADELTAGLSEEQLSKLDNIGQADEYRKMAQEVEFLDLSKGSRKELADFTADSLRDLSPSSLRVALTGAAEPLQQTQARKFIEAYAEMRRRGLSEEDIRGDVIAALKRAGFGRDAKEFFELAINQLTGERQATTRNDGPITAAKLREGDTPTEQRIAAIERDTMPRIERDEDIATQMQEAEQSLTEIQALIREGDEAAMKSADDLTTVAESEAKAYEVMASCYARRA